MILPTNSTQTNYFHSWTTIPDSTTEAAREVLPIQTVKTTDATPAELFGIDLLPGQTVTIEVNSLQFSVEETHLFAGCAQMIASANRPDVGDAVQASNLAGSGVGTFSQLFPPPANSRPKAQFVVLNNRFSVMVIGKLATNILWVGSLAITITRAIS